MKHSFFLVAVLLASLQIVRADTPEEVIFHGSLFTHSGKKLSSEVHVEYNKVTHKRLNPPISSIEVAVGRWKTIFPQSALGPSSAMWQVPRKLVADDERETDFRLYFPDCGDGARTYAVEFLIRNGRLVSRQIIPGEISEIPDSIRIFDAKGNVVYDGPCGRSGNPTGKKR